MRPITFNVGEFDEFVADGNVRATVRVVQEGVPESFQAWRD